MREIFTQTPDRLGASSLLVFFFLQQMHMILTPIAVMSCVEFLSIFFRCLNFVVVAVIVVCYHLYIMIMFFPQPLTSFDFFPTWPKSSLAFQHFTLLTATFAALALCQVRWSKVIMLHLAGCSYRTQLYVYLSNRLLSFFVFDVKTIRRRLTSFFCFFFLFSFLVPIL